MKRFSALLFALGVLVGCDAASPGGPPGGGDDTTVEPDAGDPAVTDPCETPVVIPTTGRPFDLMPQTRLAEIAGRAPCLPDGTLRETYESTQTFWYDKHSLTPGY